MAKSHGLTQEEYSKILELMGRDINLVELGLFSAMWSEHCSYKSTRVHLKNMHTKGTQVVCGPGENAGIVDIGDGDALVFKMESHNHPSFIEPFNGAATGVGGILRDVFTMGAKPVANLNFLCFGEVYAPKMKRLIEGVTNGISFYGNCVGVPMVGGNTIFDSSYNGNILVNAMAIGLVKKDKIFYSAANKSGLSLIYFGSKTGRDGIHGASMSSEEFSENSASKLPTVQVGDPFYEKLLIEACLELMANGVVISIQDMGAAGLTSSSIEMASKGGKGVEIYLENVPQRDANMSAYELMLSESQERMLMTVEPEKEDLAKKILTKWNLDYAKIGTVTDTQKIVLKMHGKVEAEIPINYLTENAPIYNRPYGVITDNTEAVSANYKSENIFADLSRILSEPSCKNKSYIYEKYDQGVQGNVIMGCGGQVGAVKVGEEYEKVISKDAFEELYFKDFVPRGTFEGENIRFLTSKALLATVACNPHYMASDARIGAMQAVCETFRNISASGGLPLAITNCLNFGSPKKPQVMGQIVEAIHGISEAAKTLNYPVVSGNASLYNETNGTGIKPTPSIGGVGVVQDFTRLTNSKFKQEGDLIFVIGFTKGHLSNTHYARYVLNRAGGACPVVNLEDELVHSNFVRGVVNEFIVNAAISVNSGGILLSLVKMSLLSNLGVNLKLDFASKTLTSYLFGEDQARFIVTTSKENAGKLAEKLINEDIVHQFIGHVSGDEIAIENYGACSLRQIREGWN